MYVDIQFYTVTAILVAICAGTVAMRDKGVHVRLLRGVLVFALLTLTANTYLLFVAFANGAQAAPAPHPTAHFGSAALHITLLVTVFLGLFSAFNIRSPSSKPVAQIIESGRG